jgi:3-hydroxyacyl-[acyl-carrier-protein] dehydratase
MRIFARKKITMLRDSFFTIEDFSKDAVSFKAVVRLHEQHPVFAGHFPGRPVTPGVFTVQMVKECVAYALGEDIRFAVLQNCRFSQTILPGVHHVLEIHGDYEQQGNEWFVKASVQAGDITFLTLKAKMTKD